MPTTTFPAAHGSTALNDQAMSRTNMWFPWPESFDDLRPTLVSTPDDLFRHSCGEHAHGLNSVSDMLTSSFGSAFDTVGEAGAVETMHSKDNQRAKASYSGHFPW